MQHKLIRGQDESVFMAIQNFYPVLEGNLLVKIIEIDAKISFQLSRTHDHSSNWDSCARC